MNIKRAIEYDLARQKVKQFWDTYLKYILIAPTLFLEFSLRTILFALAMKTLNDYKESLSIATTQADLTYPYLCMGIIVMVFNWFMVLKYAYKRELIVPSNCVFLISVFLDVLAEAYFFKCISCYNFASNDLISVRASLVIVFVLTQYANICISCSTLDMGRDKLFCVHIALSFFFALAVTSLLVLNSIVLARLGPPLNRQIGPKSIQMGFFSPAEISLIQNGTFTKKSDFESRLVGNLSDVVFSSNLKDGSRRIVRFYRFEVTCVNNETRLFYADCSNDTFTSLTVIVSYLDEIGAENPRYNCVVNTAVAKCVAKCERLFRAEYELVLVQQFKDKVEPAWTGLNRCNANPNIKLTRTDSLNPCVI